MTRLRISRRSWVPSRRLARRTRGLVLGGFWLHLVTWSRATELDRELAAGTDPMQSDDLSLRAGQLRAAKSRARLGRALRGAVNVAETRVDPLKLPPSLIRRAEVRANRDLLLELAERLGTSSPDIQGLAKTALLVEDGSSPMYQEAARRPLRVAAFDALIALERSHAEPR
jgi:hypothetical protein